jgi:soluble lytic murein transglycosylase-like protein
MGAVATLACHVGVESARADVFTFRDAGGVQHFTNAPTDRRYQAFEVSKDRLTLLKYRRAAGDAGRRASYGSVRFSEAPILRASPALSRVITQTAERHDLDPALVHAVIRAESGFNPFAVSRKGARGLMQLMPGTASDLGVRDAFHPVDNLEGGVTYLRELMDRFAGNVTLALAAYNAGPGAVENHGGIPPYAETREYLRRVMRFRQDYLHDQLQTRLASTGGVAYHLTR